VESPYSEKTMEIAQEWVERFRGELKREVESR